MSPPPRGVYEEATPIEGLRELRIVTSEGKKALVVYAAAHWIDPEFINDLRALLERKDPAKGPRRRIRLRLVP